MKTRSVSKSRCDELLLAVSSLPAGAFHRCGADQQRLWMQALSSFRYSLVLWIYGDLPAAREEAEKARERIEQLRALAEASPAGASRASRACALHAH